MKGFFRSLIKPLLPNSRIAGNEDEDELKRIAAREQKLFAFETLVAATQNFQLSRKLGQGAFGPVFKGKLDDGREIAVKKLSPSSTQGKKEFKTEAKLLARVQHKNLVNLIGYCVHGEENLLVYEHLVNESLDKHLFKADRRESFCWERRYGVILGVAKGLLYLHDQTHSCIIHRDIKASNILLDDNWVPKIADFGMARLFPKDQTHVNTRVAGTNGYMAPEYVRYGSLSTKVDVFSFGVVVLELISGERNLTFTRDPGSRDVLDWAFKLYKKQQTLDIMDPALDSSADRDQVALCIHLALLCVQFDQNSRPDMRRAVMILSRKQKSPEEPTKPGYPGSRYRRSRRATTSGSGTGTSAASTSQSFGSSRSSTQTTMLTSSTEFNSPRIDRHGKRPIQS